MATIKRFEDLKTWQKARILAQEIFLLYSTGNFAKDFPLKDQINGSTRSVMDNIAEGFGRMGNNEFINFLTFSHGSALECKSQLYRAYDRNYVQKEKLDSIFSLIDETTNMINALKNYLGKSDFRGQKFKAREKKS